MVKLTTGRLPGSSPGGRQQALLSELLQFTGDPPPDEDLTQEAVDRAFKALLEFAETARSRDDYCQLCSFVRALIPRHRVRTAFGLLLTANPDVRSRISVVASEAADFFAKKRQEIINRLNNVQGTLNRGPSTATSDGDLIDMTLADTQWSAMGVLLVLGKLVCEASSDVMISIALDKECTVAFASFALELMSFHSAVYSMPPNESYSTKRAMSGAKSFTVGSARNDRYTAEPVHCSSPPLSPKLSSAYRTALTEEEVKGYSVVEDEPTKILIGKAPKRRSTRKSTIRKCEQSPHEQQNVKPLESPRDLISNLSDDEPQQPQQQPQQLQPQQPQQLQPQQLQSVNDQAPPPKNGGGQSTPPPALGSLISLATRRTRASAVARYDSDSSGGHSVDDSPSSHRRCPPSVMATLGRGTLPSEVSGGVDELQSRAGVDHTCYSMTAARQEAMCLLPRVYDWLLPGSIGTLTAELPNAAEKLLSILNYYYTASSECSTFRFSSGTLIIHMILRTPLLMSGIFDSLYGSTLLLRLATKLANSRRRTSTSPRTKQLNAETAFFSDDGGAELMDPMTHDVISATSTGKTRVSAWNWWKRIRCFPTSSATRKRGGGGTKEDSAWTMTIIGLFEEACIDILLAMVGSCFNHSSHTAGGGGGNGAPPPTSWTNSNKQAPPNDGGISVSTPAALNQRLPPGDFCTCTTSAIVALRTCENEVTTLLRVANDTDSSMECLKAVNTTAGTTGFAQSVLMPLESRAHMALRAYRRQATVSRLVAYRYKAGFLCSYCGNSARQPQRTSGKSRSTKSLQDCDRCFMARYCTPQCQKADTTLHKTMCRGFS